MRLPTHIVLCANFGSTPLILADVSLLMLLFLITSPAVIIVEEDNEAPDLTDIVSVDKVTIINIF